MTKPRITPLQLNALFHTGLMTRVVDSEYADVFCGAGDDSHVVQIDGVVYVISYEKERFSRAEAFCSDSCNSFYSSSLEGDWESF